MGDLQPDSTQNCQLIVLACTEFCLQGAWNLARFIEREFGKAVKYDLLTVPGACHRLVREDGLPRLLKDGFPDDRGWEGVTEEYLLESDDRRTVALDDLGLAIDWHHPDALVLIQHNNCQRYHTTMTFESVAAECQVLAKDLKVAIQIVRERFPKLHVLGCMAHIDAVLGTTELTQVFDSADSAKR